MGGVRAHIRFGVEVTGATFDEATGLWTVETSAGEAHRARVLVSGAGHALTRPVLPDIPGAASFAGKAMHSARWDHSYPLEGKSVAVVGTGASAVQIVPAIAPRVSRLTVFQRTPGWVLPRPDRPTSPLLRWIFRRAPVTQKVVRAAIYAIFESFALGHVYGPRLNALHDRRGRRYLQRAVRDPELRASLTPRFRFGCKRILLSNDYYPALQRDNVELVTEPITEIRPRSVVTAGGRERPVDVIVYATGYEAAEGTPPFPVRGRGGRTLAQAWMRGGEAYLGTTVTGFPNLFVVVGPNVGLGHNSMIYMMESQFAYVLGAISALRERGLAFVDVRPEVQARYNRWVQRRLARSVWNTGGCRSWYLTRDGRNTTIWPGFTFEFRARTRRFDIERYEQAPLPC
jgi:cation diffusion facilitator CzcD-associated flavoprotein CzcO